MLYKTSTQNRHYHLFIMEDGIDAAEIETSEDKGHTHIISMVATDGGIPSVQVEEVKGHTHEIMPYEFMPEKKKKVKESEYIKDVQSSFQYAADIEQKPRSMAKKSEEMVKGNQWPSDIKAELENAKRACLTINLIQSKVDLLVGFQRQNRSDIRFYPVEDGDQRAADILNHVVKNIWDSGGSVKEESLVFEDVVVVGRGIFHIYVDRDKDPRGRIIVERMHWADVYFGPHEKDNLDDCEFLIKTKMYSVDKVKQLFPDKAKELETSMEYYSNVERDGRPDDRQYATNNYSKGDPIMLGGEMLMDVSKKNIRLMEMWRKKYKTVYIADIQDELMEVNGRDVNSLEAIGARVFKRNTFDMEIVKVAGNTFLSSELSDLPFDGFDVVPVYAKKKGNTWYGKVEAAKDPQLEVNKRSSQTADILNKVAVYGWFYDDNTFEDQKDENNFDRNSSTPGAKIKIANVERPPVKIEGVKMPAEVVHFNEQSIKIMNEVMNVPHQIQPGTSLSDVSGRAIVENRRQSLTANEFLFDNMNFAKKNIAEKIVSLIQDEYSAERIIRLIRNNAQFQDEQTAQLQQMEDEEIRMLLENQDLTKLDVVVALSPFSETQRTATFDRWAEIAQTGQVPIEFLVKLSDLPNKQEYLGILQQQQQMQAQMEQSKQQTEIQKTQIAAQNRQGGQG